MELEDIQPVTHRAGEGISPLCMRTLRGIEEWEYRRKFGLNFEPLARRLEFFEGHRWVEQSDHRWHFTPQGFLLSNTLILELLEAQARTIQGQKYWKEFIGQPVPRPRNQHLLIPERRTHEVHFDYRGRHGR